MRMGVKWCLESVKVEMSSDGGILFVVEFFNFVIDGIGWIEMKWWCRMVFVCLNGVVGVSGMHRWCLGGACMCMSVWVSEVVFVRNGCYCVCRVWMSAEKSLLGVLGCPYHQNNSLSEWGRWSLSRFFSRSRGAREDLNIPLDRGLSALHLMRSPLEPVIHTFL